MIIRTTSSPRGTAPLRDFVSTEGLDALVQRLSENYDIKLTSEEGDRHVLRYTDRRTGASGVGDIPGYAVKRLNEALNRVRLTFAQAA